MKKLKQLDYKYYIGITLIAIAIVFGSIYIFRAPESAEAEWFNYAWYYRQSISVTNNTSSDLTYFLVQILDDEDLSSLVSAGKLQSDLADLRFTDIEGNILKYWIEDSTNSSVDVWIEVLNLPADGATIYMYYGNTIASNNSNSELIFGSASTSIGTSCTAPRLKGSTVDGNYWIKPADEIFQVYCDMNTDGGGWTLVASTPTGFFPDISLSWFREDWGENPTSLSVAGAYDESKFSNLTKSSFMYSCDQGENNHAYSYDDDPYQIWGFYDNDILDELILLGDGRYNGASQTLYRSHETKRVGSGTANWPALGIGSSTCGGRTIGVARPTGTPTCQPPSTPNCGGGGTNFGFWIREDYTLISSASSTSPSSEEQGPGPIAYWSFNEGYGTTAHDETSNANDGSITGATWQTEDQCIAGKCLYFDGDGDSVSISNNQGINQDYSAMTVSAWVHPTYLNHNRIIKYGSGSPFYYKIDANGRLCPYLTIEGSTTNWQCSSGAIDLNEWSFVTFTWDGSGGQIKHYINGVYDSQNSTDTGSADYSNNTFNIGYDGNYPFFGFIDEVKIYPYTRTEAQIRNDYNAGLAGVSSNSGASMVLGGDSQKSLSDGLVGYWKMDEDSWNGTGNEVIDLSGNGNHGTSHNGATTTSTAKYGLAGEFDGVDDYVSCPSLNSSESFSVGAWINRQTIPVNSLESYLYVNNSGLRFSLDDDSDLESVLRWRLPDGSYTSYFLSDSNSLNEWIYLTIVYDGVNNILRGFKNGNLEYTYTDVAIYSNFGGGVSIGANLGNSWYFDGSVDELRIYNRALSSQEVKQLYEYAPGPIAYYNFDEKQGTTLYDKSGNGHDGTLTNMDENTDWVRGKYGSGLSFDGENDYVVFPSDGLTNQVFTVSGWWKPAPTDDVWGGSLVTAGYDDAGFDIVRSNDNVRLDINYGFANRLTWDASASYDDDVWQFVSVTYDGSLFKVYTDGIFRDSRSYTDPLVFDSDDWYLAADFPGGNEFFEGVMDEIKIYNYVRTPQQILEDMNGNRSAIKSPLVYLNFDEGYGDTAYDSSDNGYDSTISGTTRVAGKKDKALSFDGSTTMVDIPYNDFDMDEYSFSFWVKTDTNSKTIFNTYWGTPRVRMDVYGGNARFNLRGWNGESTPDVYVQGTSSIIDDSWHHIVGVKDHDYLKIYVDGIKENETTGVDNVNATSNNRETLGLGATGIYHDDYDPSYIGLLDEFKIYLYALNQDEINQEYNQGKAMVLGSSSTESDGETSSNSSDRTYCVPGDTATCNPPVAEWKFDEKTGTTLYDTTGNGNDGTLTNMEESDWTRGKIGSALDFDGDNDYVDCGNDSSLNMGTANFSWSLWFYLDEFTSDPSLQNSLISRGGSSDSDDGFRGVIYNDGHIWVTISDGTDRLQITTDSGLVGLDAWHYLSTTYDRDGNVVIYLDGKNVKEQSIVTINGDINTDKNLYIGTYTTSARFFNGKIDQVQIYDYARTPAQIAWDYNKGEPVAYWSFDEGEGTIAHDESDNLNHGTLTDMDPSTDWLDNLNCKKGGCLDFDGSNDYVESSDNSLLNNVDTFSISIWAKPYSLKKEQLFSKRDTWDSNNIEVFFQLNGTVYFAIQSPIEVDNIISNNPYNVDEWNHIVAVFDKNKESNQMSLYVNGVLSGVRDRTNNTPTNSIYPVLGRKADLTSGESFYGQMDEVKIFNYALTPLQVQQDYNLGKSIYFK